MAPPVNDLAWPDKDAQVGDCHTRGVTVPQRSALPTITVHPVYVEAAKILGRSGLAEDAGKLDWFERTFTSPAAVTLLLAARRSFDEGRYHEAQELLDDACRAERTNDAISGVRTVTEIR
jgi:hypothetical protein